MKTVNRKLMVVTQQTQQINEIHLQQFNKKKLDLSQRILTV